MTFPARPAAEQAMAAFARCPPDPACRVGAGAASGPPRSCHMCNSFGRESGLVLPAIAGAKRTHLRSRLKIENDFCIAHAYYGQRKKFGLPASSPWPRFREEDRPRRTPGATLRDPHSRQMLAGKPPHGGLPLRNAPPRAAAGPGCAAGPGRNRRGRPAGSRCS